MLTCPSTRLHMRMRSRSLACELVCVRAGTQAHEPHVCAALRTHCARNSAQSTHSRTEVATHGSGTRSQHGLTTGGWDWGRYRSEIMQMLSDEIIDPLCRDIDLDLRSHIHSAHDIQLDRENPFKSGLRDLGKFCKLRPLRFFDEVSANSHPNTTHRTFSTHAHSRRWWTSRAVSSTTSTATSTTSRLERCTRGKHTVRCATWRRSDMDWCSQRHTCPARRLSRGSMFSRSCVTSTSSWRTTTITSTRRCSLLLWYCFITTITSIRR